MDIQSLVQLPFWFMSLIVFLLGLAIGSFVNVVIYRVPRQMSIVMPGSHCPSCGTPISARDNVPVLSYLWLGARCRSCGAVISLRYPIVELILGLLFWIVWRMDGLSWSMLYDWGFVSAMIALAVIDLEHRLLPDRITYPGFVLAVGVRGLVPQDAALPWVATTTGIRASLIGAGLIASSGLIILTIEWLDYFFIGRRLEENEASLAPKEGEEWLPFLEEPSAHGKRLELATVALGVLLGVLFPLVTLPLSDPGGLIAKSHLMSVLEALAGTAVGGGMIWVLRLAYFALRKIEGAGFGDVKMMMMVGAYLGWPRTFLTLLIASVLGSMIGLAVIIRHRNRYIGIPYGIFIAVAAIIALLVGTRLVHWYWGFYQP